RTRAHPASRRRLEPPARVGAKPHGCSSRRLPVRESLSSIRWKREDSVRRERNNRPIPTDAPIAQGRLHSHFASTSRVFATGRSGGYSKLPGEDFSVTVASESAPRPLTPYRSQAKIGLPPDRPNALRTGAKRGRLGGGHLERCAAPAVPRPTASCPARQCVPQQWRRRVRKAGALHHHLVKRIFHDALRVRFLETGNNFPRRRLLDYRVHRQPVVVAESRDGRPFEGRQDGQDRSQVFLPDIEHQADAV